MNKDEGLHATAPDLAGRRTRWRLFLWGGGALILLLPLAAMQVTDEMRWGPADFAIFGAMLAAACGAFELGLRVTRRRAARVGLALAVVGAFLLVWAQLAVGILP